MSHFPIPVGAVVSIVLGFYSLCECLVRGFVPWLLERKKRRLTRVAPAAQLSSLMKRKLGRYVVKRRVCVQVLLQSATPRIWRREAFVEGSVSGGVAHKAMVSGEMSFSPREKNSQTNSIYCIYIWSGKVCVVRLMKRSVALRESVGCLLTDLNE